MKPIKTINDYRAAYRIGPYAWPGGYPIHVIMSDGEMLCHDCEKKQRRELLQALADKASWHSGWRPIAREIFYEGDEICAHCNCHIESAYGSLEDENQ